MTLIESLSVEELKQLMTVEKTNDNNNEKILDNKKKDEDK